MDDIHSGTFQFSQINLTPNNALLSLNSISNLNSKANNQTLSIPIYIFDAPNGFGLSILQAIFQIVINPFHSSHIYSAYILPDNLDRIFFEALDLKSVRKTLHYISGIGSIPKYLPVVRREQIAQYFINPVSCLHFHPGQIVTIRSPEFNNQTGQVVDIKKDTGKILIKTYPHIDYEYLRTHKNFTLQTQINVAMNSEYQAPMVPFQKEGLQTTNSSIPIWNSQVNVIKWDNKFFIGKFQYLWLNYNEITHKSLNRLTDEEKKAFEEGISDYEKMNSSFMKGFYEQLDFEGMHDSSSVLSLSLNKGTPSWARKKTLDFNFSSDTSSDSEKNSVSNTKSQPQKKVHFLKKEEVSSSLTQIQPSQQKNNSSYLSNVNNNDDSFPVLPDLDDDDETNDDTNNDDSVKKGDKNSIVRTYSPIYVGSSSSTESEENYESKSKKTSVIPEIDVYTKSILDSSSDSDIDSLFNFASNQKKSKNQKKMNASKKSSTNSKHLTSLFSSDSESESSKNQSKKAQRYLSSNSSDTEKNRKSSKRNKNKPKPNHIFGSSDESSSDVEVIEPNSLEKSNSSIVKDLLKESVDFGDSPPSEKTFFKYISSSDDDGENDNGNVQKSDDDSVLLNKEQILEEQSQQITKKRIRRYYKEKGLPAPLECSSDSYDFYSESSDS